MLRAEREKIILDMVNTHGIVSIDDLTRAANISRATAHRYIDALDALHLLIKIRGGAKSIANDLQAVNEPSINAKALMNISEKRRIAEAAMSLIQPQNHIILDSGTTVLELAKLITKTLELTVITNDISIAAELCDHRDLDMLLIGGMIRNGYRSSYGYFAESMLNCITADKLFFSVDSISPELEMMNYVVDDMNIKKICISRARERILLCDHSKFYAKAPFAFEHLSAIDTIIVGSELDPGAQNKLTQLGKRLILV